MSLALRIVIVEDDALIAMDLADLLIGMNHEVCAIARSQTDAVAAASRFQPDLMIVDGTLGEGSGVAAMQRVLELGFVAHFYVTGDPWAVRGLVPDAIVVTKPFTLRELNRAITMAHEAGQGLKLIF